MAGGSGEGTNARACARAQGCQGSGPCPGSPCDTLVSTTPCQSPSPKAALRVVALACPAGCLAAGGDTACRNRRGRACCCSARLLANSWPYDSPFSSPPGTADSPARTSPSCQPAHRPRPQQRLNPSTGAPNKSLPPRPPRHRPPSSRGSLCVRDTPPSWICHCPRDQRALEAPEVLNWWAGEPLVVH